MYVCTLIQKERNFPKCLPLALAESCFLSFRWPIFCSDYDFMFSHNIFHIAIISSHLSGKIVYLIYFISLQFGLQPCFPQDSYCVSKIVHHTYFIGHYNPSVWLTTLFPTGLLLCVLISYVSSKICNLTSTSGDWFVKHFMAIQLFSELLPADWNILSHILSQIAELCFEFASSRIIISSSGAISCQIWHHRSLQIGWSWTFSKGKSKIWPSAVVTSPMSFS